MNHRQLFRVLLEDPSAGALTPRSSLIGNEQTVIRQFFPAETHRPVCPHLALACSHSAERQPLVVSEVLVLEPRPCALI